MLAYQDFVPRQRFQPALAFSPGCDLVAYSSNADGRSALWTVPASGGPPRKLAQPPGRVVRQVAWSPDGASVVFTADHEGDEQYGIFLMSLADDEPTSLTEGSDCQRVLATNPFDPTGRYLVYAANDRDPTVQDLLVRDLTTGSERRIEPEEGVAFVPTEISPDGHWLLASGFRSNTEIDIYLIDLTDPEPKPRCVTDRYGTALFQPQAWAPDSSGFYLLTDLWGFTAVAFYHLADDTLDSVVQHDWNVELLDAANGTLIWTVNEAGRSTPYIRRGERITTLPTIPSGVISTLTLAADGQKAAVLLDTASRPEEIVLLDLNDGSLRYLTDARPPALHTIDPIEPESITYPAADDRTVHAFLYRPRTPGPHPVLLSIHGGPEQQERPRYSALYQYLLHHGIAVFAPNIAGSTGYGRAYQKLIYRDWGGIDLDDLDHAVRYLATHTDLDPQRLAAYGGSYGGFAALSCLARLPYRWAAGVSICGPTNLVTLAQDAPPTWRTYVDTVLGNPDADAQHLLSRSPITHADAIDAPLLILQGARDPRVPRAESDSLVERLRARGVKVRYEVFPDEGHGFTIPTNEVRAYTQTADFLLTHLRGNGQ
ncbi:S9 family peptidase [Actinomadura kijaniata]|uniref:Dipeptidyl aminopeptidase/acylaminoacyl peptidase n=1 Tax=Actinomadura namibiensis TaxID=182080 RepID=A0A7W3LY98_ACTNM|nr:S9 family peptidase [Actinomadura namibiensis]MBA8956566.1 dipeptidyl aminopeptidase/acylaminoacyl peptidase [Actinomadura namibiensis]